MKGKNLSWQVLLGLTILFYIISKILGGVIGNALIVLVVITGAMAVIDFFRFVFKSSKNEKAQG